MVYVFVLIVMVLFGKIKMKVNTVLGVEKN